MSKAEWKPSLSVYHAALARRSATETAKKLPVAVKEGDPAGDGLATTAEGLTPTAAAVDDGDADGATLEQAASVNTTTSAKRIDRPRRIHIRPRIEPTDGARVSGKNEPLDARRDRIRLTDHPE